MNIKTVKLRNAGFGGAEIHYFIEEVKGNRKSHTLIKKYPKDPVHKDLENLFKDLRPFLLDICQITNDRTDQDELKFIIMESAVTGIEFDSDGFILHGEKEVFGDKKIKLNTPKVEEIDNYSGYNEVLDIVKQIITETKLYLEGEKKVSDEELVERWVESHKDKAMSVDAFNNLSADERREYFTKVLEEQFGSVVMHQGEMVEETGVIEMEESFTIDPNQDEVIIPVGEKKKTKKKDVPAEKPEEAL